MATERFLIPESGPDVEAKGAGIRWVLQWAQAAGQSRAAIIAPGVREIEPLERALGSRVANILSRQREFEAEPGLTLEILLGASCPSATTVPYSTPSTKTIS